MDCDYSFVWLLLSGLNSSFYLWTFYFRSFLLNQFRSQAIILNLLMSKSLQSIHKRCHKDGHENQQVLMVCLSQKCKQNLFCCVTCIEEEHIKHEVISFRKLEKLMGQKLQKYNKNMQKGKISKLFYDYQLKFKQSIKSLQNQLLSKIQSLQDQVTDIFNEVYKVLNIPFHNQLIEELLQTQNIEDWASTIQCIKLTEKYDIGTVNNTTLVLSQELKTFNKKITAFKSQFIKKIGEISGQLKSLNFCSQYYEEQPIFHPIYKYTDMMRLDNYAIIEKKKNNGNRTIALGNRPLDPVNNQITFNIIKNGDGVPSICIGVAVLSIVKMNNFVNCTGSKRGVYCIDQSSTSTWGQIQPSNEATSWNQDLTTNNATTIGFQFGQGDTIKMTVDYPSGTLIFEMDEEIYDMDINCSYKDLYPFVGISNSNAVVEILE